MQTTMRIDPKWCHTTSKHNAYHLGKCKPASSLCEVARTPTPAVFDELWIQRLYKLTANSLLDCGRDLPPDAAHLLVCIHMCHNATWFIMLEYRHCLSMVRGKALCKRTCSVIRPLHQFLA